MVDNNKMIKAIDFANFSVTNDLSTNTAVTAVTETEKISKENVAVQNLVFIQNDIPVTTSLLVAEVFGKRHADVIRNVENAQKTIETTLQSNERKIASVDFFRKSEYKDSKGEMRIMYYLTRDGLSYLVMGFTGVKAAIWKLRYIEEFNRMEQYIRDQQKPKPMSHLEVTLANCQALIDLEKQTKQNTQDIEMLKQEVMHPFSRINMETASNTRHIADHEERITSLESFGEDKGPAEDLKSLVNEAYCRYGETIPYQDLYNDFYTSLKNRFTIDIWARLRSLKVRRKKEGWSKTKVDKLSTLDAITANPDIWTAVRQGIQLVRQNWVEA